MVDFLNQGWVGSTIALLGILIGGGIALWFYLSSRLGARIVYQRRSLRLIGSTKSALPSEVEIRFRGVLVERLTKTQLVIWNSGNQTLAGSSIVAADPVRFEFSETAKVLEIEVIKSTRNVNQFIATNDSLHMNWIKIQFDFLDAKDGAIIGILHTDQELYPSEKGTIRGVPKGVLNWGEIKILPNLKFPFHRIKNPKIIFYILVFIGLLIICFGIFAPKLVVGKTVTTENTIISRIIISVAGFIYLLPPTLTLWFSRRRYPKLLGGLDI